MDNKKLLKVAQKMVCEKCTYVTCKKSSYKKHLLTAKHTKMVEWITMDNKKLHFEEFQCKCSKKYKYPSGLCKHKKKCTFENEEKENGEKEKENEEKEKENGEKEKEKDQQNLILDASLNQIEHLSNIVIDMVKQNQEFKQLLVEQNKQMLELTTKPSTVTNYNNNTMNNNNFNLNVFLNETCKDAMNLTDFVNSLSLTLKDLEDTGKLGYEEGISQIFINGLKELDVSKRPIHCSDIKREKLYVRNSNIWEKDQEQEHLRKAVRKVANKNVNQIIDWIKANPESQNYNSKKNDQYLQIVIKSTGGSTKEEEEKRIGKVITNIAKHVEIDKGNR
jgi:hypothetical protein